MLAPLFSSIAKRLIVRAVVLPDLRDIVEDTVYKDHRLNSILGTDLSRWQYFDAQISMETCFSASFLVDFCYIYSR